MNFSGDLQHRYPITKLKEIVCISRLIEKFIGKYKTPHNMEVKISEKVSVVSSFSKDKKKQCQTNSM